MEVISRDKSSKSSSSKEGNSTMVECIEVDHANELSISSSEPHFPTSTERAVSVDRLHIEHNSTARDQHYPDNSQHDHQSPEHSKHSKHSPEGSPDNSPAKHPCSSSSTSITSAVHQVLGSTCDARLGGTNASDSAGTSVNLEASDTAASEEEKLQLDDPRSDGLTETECSAQIPDSQTFQVSLFYYIVFIYRSY